MFNLRLLKSLFILACMGILASTSFAQKKNIKQLPKDSVKTDTTKKLSKPKLRSYKEVITSQAKTSKGLFTVHVIDDKYYFEIPTKILGRDLLILNRIAEASADIRGERSMAGFAGDDINGTVVAFEKGPNKNIFIRRKSYTEYHGDSTKTMYASVKKNNLEAVVAAFPIVAYGPDSLSMVFDATAFLNEDSELLYFNGLYKSMFHVGIQKNDRSYVKYVHTYPNNVEVRAVKTYNTVGTFRVQDMTVELNSSIVILPEKPMKPRYYDERVGYFTTRYLDYDMNPQGVSKVQIANRWKLEPKPEDVAKYKRGELVEPQKPIVYYIDPSTPEKWVPYLIQGVNDWNKAFEKAGFKNAIIGRKAPSPQEDSTFSLEDARHAAIVYKPSSVPNASGPSIADPRSGEILDSHINWYHNVMSLAHSWYMIQAGAIDKRAQKMQFDDELMGQLIRFISSHEVGHTLGLRHNFGSSSTVPVEKLRDKVWLEENGHTPSIMDYARFNYVAQPEDNVSEKGIFPRIGDYDIWAIQWGYKWYDDKTSAEEDQKVLATLTTEMQKNKRLWFGTEQNPVDPRSQNEDLGDNAMIASEYGIKNLKRIVPHLIEWTKEPNKNFDELKNTYILLNRQFDRYAMHVMKNIAGVYETPKTTDQDGPVYELVSKAKQKEAFAYIDRNLFSYPAWLYDELIFGKLGIDFIPFLTERQGGLLESLLSTYRLTRMINNESVSKEVEVYKASEFLEDITKGMFREVQQAKKLDAYKRNFQKMYVDKLIKTSTPTEFPMLMMPPEMQTRAPYAEILDAKTSDISSLLKYQLKSIQKIIQANMLKYTDITSVAHLEDLNERITKFFKRDK